MIKVYLARHGQTEWNVEKRLQGRKNSPLTALGKRQALALAQRMATLPLDRIWSSSSGRALETAKIVLEGRHDSPHFVTSDALQEMHLGEWEGQTKDTVRDLYSDASRLFWEQPHEFSPFGGESFEEAQKRVGDFVADAVRDTSLGQDSAILLISHGMAIQLLLNAVRDDGLENLYNNSVVHQAGLSLVIADPTLPIRKWEIVFQDDRTHLGDLQQNSGQVV